MLSPSPAWCKSSSDDFCTLVGFVKIFYIQFRYLHSSFVIRLKEEIPYVHPSSAHIQKGETVGLSSQNRKNEKWINNGEERTRENNTETPEKMFWSELEISGSRYIGHAAVSIDGFRGRHQGRRNWGHRNFSNNLSLSLSMFHSLFSWFKTSFQICYTSTLCSTL